MRQWGSSQSDSQCARFHFASHRSGTGPTLLGMWAALPWRQCEPVWMHRGRRNTQKKLQQRQRSTPSRYPHLAILLCLDAASQPPRLARGMRGFSAQPTNRTRTSVHAIADARASPAAASDSSCFASRPSSAQPKVRNTVARLCDKRCSAAKSLDWSAASPAARSCANCVKHRARYERKSASSPPK